MGDWVHSIGNIDTIVNGCPGILCRVWQEGQSEGQIRVDKTF